MKPKFRFSVRPALTPLVAASVALMFGMLAPVQAQEAKSVAAAKELAAALDAAKLDSIAAVDPSDPTTFVAALYFPGAQLLVVSAKYAAPPLLVAKMSSKNYRDIYIDLNSASVAGSKVFIIDQSCDGLVARPDGDQAADTFENGSSQLAFDGDWRKAKLSEDEYMKAFSEADQRYARILSLLAAQAKGAS
ncbi:MAG TPA: hypothetical protein VFO14_18145 [Vicinamibacterales bacterium]|nr:hypothetical protein [Vicinamibacterales bacterium]